GRPIGLVLYNAKFSVYDSLGGCRMRHFMLLLGIGTSLLASSACATPPDGTLARAAVADAADAVGRLRAAGHPPDESSDDGITPLMWAARYGATQSIAVLPHEWPDA